MNKSITIEILAEKDIETVWKVWTSLEYIMQWAFASDDWECPHAENDVIVGGNYGDLASAGHFLQGLEKVASYFVK